MDLPTEQAPSRRVDILSNDQDMDHEYARVPRNMILRYILGQLQSLKRV